MTSNLRHKEIQAARREGCSLAALAERYGVTPQRIAAIVRPVRIAYSPISCPRCGAIWTPRGPDPLKCPRCFRPLPKTRPAAPQAQPEGKSI
jgi:hypothetical protein